MKLLRYTLWLFFLIMFSVSSFKPKDETRWKATLTVTSKNKTVALSSESVYGGFNTEERSFFLFGKIHMFGNETEPQILKIFNDYCITNSVGQFEFSGSATGSNANNMVSNGFLTFSKKTPVSFRITQGKNGNRLVIKQSFSKMGFTPTEEAKAAFSDEFELSFTELK